MKAKNMRLAGLDRFRMVAAFLVVSIHTSPFLSINGTLDFAFTRIIARVGVPFFYMVTGYFLLGGILSGSKESCTALRNFTIKTCKIYGLAILFYLPANLYAKQPEGFSKLLKMLFVDGMFYHLWYFPAVILGVWVVWFLLKKLSPSCTFIICVALYLLGLLGDSYYGITEAFPLLKSIYDVFFAVSAYTRNGLFYAPLFLVLGALLSGRSPCTRKSAALGFALSMTAMLIEGILLHTAGWQRHDSMYLSLPVCMWFLFQRMLTVKGNVSNRLPKLSLLIYILHPMMIIWVRGFAKLTGLQNLLIENSLFHYLAVCLLSVTLAVFVVMTQRFLKSKQTQRFAKGRAWIEIDLASLRHNVSELRTLLPTFCALMPAVKADAYGHGAVPIAKALWQVGVRAFCVACAHEAVALRKSGVKGELLILGYTHPKDFPLLRRYHLTQTVLDLAYAEQLSQYGRPIKVYVKIDTGMRRIGERSENIENLMKIFRYKNLIVTGVFTHLCVSDSLKPDDVAFTKLQIDRFYETIKLLRSEGCTIPKLHIQSSYGVLNYPELSCDYARVGIALYGVLSSADDDVKCSIALQPVLSLRARVILVKNVLQGEPVGYGRTFTAPSDMTIAVLSIGYADGVPRALSCGAGHVLLHGQPALIVGRICMDQMSVDISHIAGVAPSDIATLIGTSGQREITAMGMAADAGTITNELLARMGSRVERTYYNHL